MMKPCRGAVPDGWVRSAVPGWIQPAPVEPEPDPIPGPEGPSGKDGIDGKDGVDGKDGADGKDGKDGINGRDGKDGKNGKDGKQGPIGKSGKDGKNGSDGLAGVGIADIIGFGHDLIIKMTDGSEKRFRLPSSSSSFGGGSSSISTVEEEVVYSTNYDKVSDTIAYVGEALPGSPTSASVWRIKRLDTADGDLVTTWADGVADFTHIWDNRLTLNYS